MLPPQSFNNVFKGHFLTVTEGHQQLLQGAFSHGDGRASTASLGAFSHSDERALASSSCFQQHLSLEKLLKSRCWSSIVESLLNHSPAHPHVHRLFQ
ncbi:unnamed protein product [Victoria cruziana]